MRDGPATPSLTAELAARIEGRTARVCVIGLGYVGLPLAETFASGGYSVLGFDIDPEKIRKLQAGQSYIGHIPARRVAELVATGRFEPTCDPGLFRPRRCHHHLRSHSFDRSS